MITTGSKWFFGLGLVSLVLAAAYGWTTGGNGLGPLTFGYKGGVGDHFGYTILVAGAAIGVTLGFVSTAVRDADAEAVAQVAGTDTVPPVVPVGASYWPPVTAFGVALVVIGVVSSSVLVVFGLIALGIVLIEWTVQTWADHATGDPEVNRSIRNRVMSPLEFPVGGFLVVAAIVLALSRVFLALSAGSTVVIAAAVALLILLTGALVAARPQLSSNLVVGIVMFAVLVILGLGVAGVVAGERDFHEQGALPAPVHESTAPADAAPPTVDGAVVR